MPFEVLNQRLNYLLEGLELQSITQDHPVHITLKFKNGPKVSIGIPEGSEDFDISVTGDFDTSQEWIDRAENPNAPPPVKRQ